MTNELYPVTKGGCGTLIFNSMLELLNKGFQVVILADLKKKIVQLFLSNMAKGIPHIEHLKIITVNELLKSVPKSKWIAAQDTLEQSKRFYYALHNLLQFKSIDIIEFPEYFGWAYHTLAYFQSYPNLTRPTIVVRFHLSMELIDSVSVENYGLHRHIIYMQERYGLNRADQVLMSSQATGEWVNELYNIKINYNISPPSFSGLNITPRKRNIDEENIILFYARLAPQKGAELFVNAAIRLLSNGIDPKIRFVVAGPDMKEAPGGGSWIKYLKSQIPVKFKQRFDFPGNLEREQWYDLLPQVIFAVMPSRVETYCYGVRELALAGVPTIISNIPPFKDLIEGNICLGCDLDSEDIANKMSVFLTNTKLRESFTAQRITIPALGTVYDDQTMVEGHSNISSDKKSNLSLTLVILKDENSSSSALEKTISSISIENKINVWLAEPDSQGHIMVMGRLCNLIKHSDRNPVDIPVDELLCIAMAGDIFDSEYLAWALDILENDVKLGFVGCATRPSSHIPSASDEFPWDAAPGALPLAHPGHLCRCIIRGKKEYFQERMDPQLLFLQEANGIWKSITNGHIGIRNPNMSIVTESNIQSWTDINSDSLNSTLHILLSRYQHNADALNLLMVLKAMIHEPKIPPPDLLSAINHGKTPEIGTLRLNSKNLLRLLLLRIKSFF